MRSYLDVVALLRLIYFYNFQGLKFFYKSKEYFLKKILLNHNNEYNGYNILNALLIRLHNNDEFFLVILIVILKHIMMKIYIKCLS